MSRDRINPVPFEDWTSGTFVPFSPRHGVETDLSPEFPCEAASRPAERFHSDVTGQCNPEADLSSELPAGLASQLAECFHSDVAGQCHLQLPNDEVLESIESAIDTEVHELLSKCANYSVPCEDVDDNEEDDDDDDRSSEDNVSGDDQVSDSQLENKIEARSLNNCSGSDSSTDDDNDIYIPPCLKAGDDIFTSSKQANQCNLDALSFPMNSICRNLLVEEWLAKYHAKNLNNASVLKKRKKDGKFAQGFVNATKTPPKCDSNQATAGNSVQVASSYTDNRNNASLPKKGKKFKEEQEVKSSVNVNKAPAKRDDDMSKHMHLDQSVINKDGNQDACFAYEQHPAIFVCNNESPNAQQLSECKSQLLYQESLPRKYKKKKSTSKLSLASASHTKNWKVINISKRCSLFTYKQEILRQPCISQPHMNYTRQIYCHIGEKWALTYVRHVRGDNYAAVRAILYQALVNNFLQECYIGKLEDICEKLSVFADARNRFLRCWNFANRIPYRRGKEVDVLSNCLEEFHSVVEMMTCVPSRVLREDYLMCLLNRNPDVDIRLLESVKFLMMEKALCVYRQMEWRRKCCYPQPAEFWLFTSLCPDRLFRQKINPLGDSVKAGPMEYQLLGYALGIQIEIIQPKCHECCDFSTRYLLENMKGDEKLCLIIEDDNEYCVLTA